MAFGVVELNTPLPFDLLCEMSPTDPLYRALVKAWKEKERRLDNRNAMLCCVIANTQGNKTKPEDFLPKTIKTTEEVESDIKANFQAYNERVNTKK